MFSLFLTALSDQSNPLCMFNLGLNIHQFSFVLVFFLSLPEYLVKLNKNWQLLEKRPWIRYTRTLVLAIFCGRQWNYCITRMIIDLFCVLLSHPCYWTCAHLMHLVGTWSIIKIWSSGIFLDFQFRHTSDTKD